MDRNVPVSEQPGHQELSWLVTEIFSHISQLIQG